MNAPRLVGLVRRHAADELAEGQLAVAVGVDTPEHLQLVADHFVGGHIAEMIAIAGLEPVLGKVLGRSLGIVDGDVDGLRGAPAPTATILNTIAATTAPPTIIRAMRSVLPARRPRSSPGPARERDGRKPPATVA